MNTVESGEFARVFVGHDTAWVCVGDTRYKVQKRNIVHFCKKMDRIDTFGCRTHADVICALFDSDCRSKLRIGTPQVINRHPPETVPRNLCELALLVDNLPRFAGGWHAASEVDYWTFRLIDALHNNQNAWSRCVEYAFKRHPVWPAASFAASCGGDLLAASHVVKHIVDPRWFVDLKNPERDSRLRIYMGLTPRAMRAYLLGESVRCQNHGRAAEVVLASLGHDFPAVDTTASHVFHEVFAREPSNVKGLIKAGELFLSLVQQLWLNAAAPHGNELFVPAYFFERTPFGKATAEVFEKFFDRRSTY